MMVSVRTIRMALQHPSLLLYFLNGASFQELDARVHASRYWPTELRKIVFKEIDKLSELYSRNASYAETARPTDAQEFIRRCVLPLAGRFVNSEFSMRSHAALYLLCRGTRPQVIVETGTYWGISTSVILRALHENGNGTLYSIDLPNGAYVTDEGKAHIEELPEGTSTGSAIPDYLRDRWHLTIGDSAETLVPLLKRLGKIDLFFHDSKHTYSHMLWEYNTVWNYLRQGGILTSHDIHWNSAFDDFCNAIGASCSKIEVFGIAVKT